MCAVGKKTIMEAAKKDVFLLRGQWPYSRSSWRLVPWRSSEEHLFMSAVTPMHSTPSANPRQSRTSIVSVRLPSLPATQPVISARE